MAGTLYLGTRSRADVRLRIGPEKTNCEIVQTGPGISRHAQACRRGTDLLVLLMGFHRPVQLVRARESATSFLMEK